MPARASAHEPSRERVRFRRVLRQDMASRLWIVSRDLYCSFGYGEFVERELWPMAGFVAWHLALRSVLRSAVDSLSCRGLRLSHVRNKSVTPLRFCTVLSPHLQPPAPQATRASAIARESDRRTRITSLVSR